MTAPMFSGDRFDAVVGKDTANDLPPKTGVMGTDVAEGDWCDPFADHHDAHPLHLTQTCGCIVEVLTGEVLKGCAEFRGMQAKWGQVSTRTFRAACRKHFTETLTARKVVEAARG